MANLPEIINDEISLEGLDGITLKGLWERIKNRSPKSFVESSKVCNLCWEYIRSQECFLFYTLPLPRDDIRLDLTSLKAASEEALFKVNIIDQDGVLGSCEDYSTRKRVKRSVLANMTYEAVMEQHGHRLVIVADQKTRRRTLIPPHMVIPDENVCALDYAILERVGRSRNLGEKSSGKNSLQDFVADARSMFFRRKVLCKLGLLCVFRDSTSNLNIYLPRFVHDVVVMPREKVAERIIEEALASPDHSIASVRAREIFNEVFAGDSMTTWKVFRRCSAVTNNFTMTRAIRFCPEAKKDVSLNLLVLKANARLDRHSEDLPEEKQTEFLDWSGQYYSVPVEKQALITIEAAGNAGATAAEIRSALGISRNNIRTSLKSLARAGLVVEEKRQLGSTTSIVFFSAELKRAQKEAAKNKPSVDANALPSAREQEKESPQVLELVDVYGVTTTIKVEPKDLAAAGGTYKIDTQTKVQRVKALLDIVQSLGISSNLQTLANSLSEGEGIVVCRKTVRRLVQHLIDRGLVSAYAASFQREKIVKSTSLFCDATRYNMQHERFQELLKNLHKKMVPLVNMKLEALTKKQLNLKMKHRDKHFLNFMNLKPLHRFLMHVAWFADRAQEVDDVPDEWIELMGKGEKLPAVYDASELSWLTFLNPRKVRGDAVTPNGWTTVSELAELMPLSMVYDLYQPIENARNVPSYLKHPVKQYYMISQCATAALVNNPWFLETFILLLEKLCFVGLLRFGTVVPFKKANMPVYLNRRRYIYDTATTDYVKELPPREECQRIEYEFTSPRVVDEFWVEMARVCLNTQLPRNKFKGYTGTAKDLKEWLKPITEQEAIAMDDGSIPGDGRGAAGTHRGMTLHMYYYWDVTMRRPHVKVVRLSKAKGPTKKVLVETQKRQRVYKKVYDEVDEYARGATGLQRSKWTPAEDTTLLLTRLANLYLSPNRGHMQMISCVAYRDVLHWMCQSLDKSAKVCNRRTQFLCKNDVTKATIDICLKELAHTKQVAERYGPDFAVRLKEVYTGDEEFSSAMKIHFVGLVRILSGIFSKLTATEFTKRAKAILPATVEEFHRRFVVLDHDSAQPDWEKGLKRDDRIKLHTVYNVVHSSMCCAEDDFSYNLIMLDIYRGFSEQVLASAMEQAKQLQLITKFKINQVQARKTIPLNTRPFHLSGYYSRRFIINYNWQILDRVEEWVEEARSGKGEFSNVNKWFSFFFSGLNSRGVIEVANLAETNVRRVHMAREKGGDDDDNDEENDAMDVVDEGKRVTFKPEIDIHDFDYEPTETMLKVNSVNWHLFCYVKDSVANNAYLVTDKEMLIDEEGACNFNCCLGQVTGVDDMVEYLASVNVRDFKNGIKRVLANLATEKEKMVAANRKDLGKVGHLKRMKVAFINLLDDMSRDAFDPLVRQVTDIRLKEGVVFPREPNKELFNERLLRWGLIERPEESTEGEFKEKHAAEVTSLLEFIKLYEIDGAPLADIVESFRRNDALAEQLLMLLDRHWVLFCGAGEIRLVHYEFRQPWTIRSYRVEEPELGREEGSGDTRLYLGKRPSTTKSVHPKTAKKLFYGDDSKRKGGEEKRTPIELRMFPWIRVTGTVNQRVVDKLVGSIVLHLQGKAGIPLPEVFKKFSQFHESHLILILLVMKELRLIELFKMASTRPTLFSTYQSPTIEPANLLLDNPNDMYIEPATDCVLSYCELRGKVEYKKHYC